MIGVDKPERGQWFCRIDLINSNLGLSLSTSVKPTPYEIFDEWAQTQGLSGIDYFETNGVTDTSVRAPDGKYTYAMAPPYHGARHRLYGEKLLEYGETMAAEGIDPGDFPPISAW